jgi:hypothetical protein
MKQRQLDALRNQIAELKEKTRDPATRLEPDDIRKAILFLSTVAEHVLEHVQPEPDDLPERPAEFQRSVRR